MATIQSEVGRIRLMEDFCGTQYPTAFDDAVHGVGPFRVGGEGVDQTSAGIAALDIDGLNGVGHFTTGDTDVDTTFIGTSICLDVALMGTLVLEARVRFPTVLTAKAAFIGFSSICADDLDLEEIINYSDGEVVTLTAPSQAGFYFSSQFDDSTSWHTVHKGGTTSSVTDTTAIDLPDDDPTADEFQVLRVEIDNNATTRWFVDGVLKKTLEGAVSTGTDLAALVAVTENGGSLAQLDLDYILVTANRDWTV